MPDTPPVQRRVPYVNFPAQYALEKDAIHACVERVFSKGIFIGGEEVELLEQEIAALLGVRHVIALNSGTDALILALRGFGIGPGDEVITPPNSFVASTAAIIATGAIPVFADVKPDQNIDPAAVARAITPRTKAIMPVHLTGRVAEMDTIMEIAGEHCLKVIEDAAQAFGSRYQGKMSGALGHAGCFSAHPLKNLNAAGDGGFVTTDDDSLAEYVRLTRNHGLKDRDTVVCWGTVSRLDTLQAAFLRTRLGTLDSVSAARRANADLYRKLLPADAVYFPPCLQAEFNTFHTFVVQLDDREALRTHLITQGIETAIHYPIPIHLQPVAAELGHKPGAFPNTEMQAKRILSLPVHQFLQPDDIRYVADTIREFYA